MVRDKHAAFRRLAITRVNKALNYIRLIGNLSNKQNYIYTDKEVKAIFQTLDRAIAKIKILFETPKEFRL